MQFGSGQKRTGKTNLFVGSHFRDSADGLSGTFSLCLCAFCYKLVFGTGGCRKLMCTAASHPVFCSSVSDAFRSCQYAVSGECKTIFCQCDRSITAGNLIISRAVFITPYHTGENVVLCTADRRWTDLSCVYSL